MDKGTERKKRKVEDDEVETEEEEMKKFFALIKSTRRLGGVLDKRKESEEDPVKENQEKQKIEAAAGWCPKFQPEDFEIDKINSVPAPLTLVAGPSTPAEEDQEKEEVAEVAEEKSDFLNLKLSLYQFNNQMAVSKNPKLLHYFSRDAITRRDGSTYELTWA
ncbi:hypothetical protein ACET3Z_030830 [Daucus carota]